MNHVKYSGLHLFLIFKIFFLFTVNDFFIYMNNYEFILLDNSMIF
jgi:hypothetical protein